MTNSNAPVPAGWYPDPAGGPKSRWWDGTQWTDNFQEPYTPASAATLKAPEGAKSYNVWIWLVVLLPYATVPFLFPFMNGMLEAIMNAASIDNPYAASEAQFALMYSPAFMILTVLGWVVTALTIFFSYRDWKALLADGVPQPFHWAFSFLSLVVGPVYPIGRAIVVKRRTGHGSAVLWVTIILLVATVVGTFVWFFALMAQLMQAVGAY